MARLGVLGERQFRRYFAGQATSWLGDGLLPVAISFAVLELTGSASDLGLVLAARIVPVAVFVLAGGVWADRLPRQWVMIGSDVARCGTQAILAALLLTGSAELWHLLILQVFYGVAEAFWRPASTALLPSIVPAERLQQANALLAVTVNGSYTIGPAVAGILVALSGSGVAIAVDAATFAASTAALLTLRVPTLERPGEETSFLNELREGWGEFASRTWLWVVVAWASVFLMLVVGPLMVLGPVVADRELGGAAAWGSIAASSGVGVIVGSIAAGRLRPVRPMFVAVILGSPSALFAVSLALALPTAVVAGAAFLEGLGHGMFEVIWLTALQQRVAPAALARVSSYDALGSFVFMPVGLALAGPAAETFGTPEVLLAVAGFALASSVSVAVLPAVRGFRRLEEPGYNVA
ncbi:MAG: MFS transporter [Actinomycetota bacterium]|nr:MFS transporter [Actinomycetota bacterium]